MFLNMCFKLNLRTQIIYWQLILLFITQLLTVEFRHCLSPRGIKSRKQTVTSAHFLFQIINDSNSSRSRD
jgi:hypothetical protein